ncbi:hydrogenase maturation protease [Streptomyces sp. NPDC008313]|uniref:hydrogenase maturation protease n=1 Tax=Streptomyces sp. NPDC008313 TaxID=3364826 RepID=UPI0036F12EC2
MADSAAPTTLPVRKEDGADETAPEGARVLVAGIGNIFLADDAFGPEVIKALRGVPFPPGVDVHDFGIRGLDLAYRLQDGYAAVVLVDASPRGDAPGTLYVIEPEPQDDAAAAPEAHGMDPVKVLALARHLGDAPLPRVVVLGCEPEISPRGDEDIIDGLSASVREAVGRAAALLPALARSLAADPEGDIDLSQRAPADPA